MAGSSTRPTRQEAGQWRRWWPLPRIAVRTDGLRAECCRCSCGDYTPPIMVRYPPISLICHRGFRPPKRVGLPPPPFMVVVGVGVVLIPRLETVTLAHRVLPVPVRAVGEVVPPTEVVLVAVHESSIPRRLRCVTRRPAPMRGRGCERTPARRKPRLGWVRLQVVGLGLGGRVTPPPEPLTVAEEGPRPSPTPLPRSARRPESGLA